MNDALNACEANLAQAKRKLAARAGKVAYRDSNPVLEAEIARLEQNRERIIAAQEADAARTPVERS